MIDKLVNIKDGIGAIGDLLDKLFTSDEERLQAQAVMEKLRQHKDELDVELKKIEASDRANAREREVELSKNGKKDWMPSILAISILLGYFIFMGLLMIDNGISPDYQETFKDMGNTLRDGMFLILSYYFGYQAALRKKDEAPSSTKLPSPFKE